MSNLTNGNGNPFAKNTPQAGALEMAEQHRAIQEVQAAMVIAKKFPRDPFAAFDKIIEACRRKTLAEGAMYAYPRGDTTVTGPSIRLAEAIAQNWGNMSFGIRELSSRGGSSEVEAFAWDMESNTKQVKIFNVKHERHTKKGKKFLTDPRDIYETVANNGARRMRACILGVIPGDVVEAAVRQCQQTLLNGQDGALLGQVPEMLKTFSEMEITVQLIEKRYRMPVSDINAEAALDMKNVLRSIKDGIQKKEVFFDIKTNVAHQDDRARNAGERFAEEGQR